jgi:hypothetical protein
MRAIDLLQSERAVIAGEADSPALRAVLAQADLLVRKLRAKLPHTAVVVPVDPANGSGAKSSAAPKSSASAKPSPSPSPKPSPKPSPSASPTPSSTASPSASPSNGGPFPGTLPH